MRATRTFAIIAAVSVLVVTGCAMSQTASEPAASQTTTLSPADAIARRHQQMHDIGGAFKAAGDSARSGTPDLALIRTNAQTIARIAQELPASFPAGSGPESGLETHAKAEVWTNAAGFAEQVRLFQTASQDLATAPDAEIGARLGQLGARCGSCHTAFRAQH